jgi:hypothetical protein
MAMLKSTILAGNPRLESAASGGPSVKMAPPYDDANAVRRIQKALVALGYSMPISFPAGPAGEPDGRFGQETYRTVVAFQKGVFPRDASQWDGRVGKYTLGRMDELLAGEPVTVTLPAVVIASSRCEGMFSSDG